VVELLQKNAGKVFFFYFFFFFESGWINHAKPFDESVLFFAASACQQPMKRLVLPLVHARARLLEDVCGARMARTTGWRENVKNVRKIQH
jgi:hypothetical protein